MMDKPIKGDIKIPPWYIPMWIDDKPVQGDIYPGGWFA